MAPKTAGMVFGSLYRHCLVLLLALGCAGAAAQAPAPSVVEPGEHFTLRLNGEPFFPLGWKMVGHCPLPDERFTAAWDSVETELERLRRRGINTVFETVSSNGRVVPRQVDPGWYNWYSYTTKALDSTSHSRGHARVGAHVAAMQRFMDLAHTGTVEATDQPIYTILSLYKFAIPEGDAHPYGGSDTLRCEAYRAFIEEERARHAATGSDAVIPPADCSGPGRLPFWEWNLRYVVRSLRNHPGLLAWYLWDEPEDVTWRSLFGILPEGLPAPAYTGPQSLPTPDFLRHVYRRVVAFELEGQAPGYRRHPVVLDLHTPEAFFSNRFAWSKEGRLNERYNNGPFDRAPNGKYHVPADILGLEASSHSRQMSARGDRPPLDWYWDQNLVSQRAALLAEAVERDSLWAGIVIAGQGQLSSGGPYGLAEPLRCGDNPRSRMRLLNDRDLLWHFLTPIIDGLRGYLYYTRIFTPVTGPGAEQVKRSDRLMQQFQEAGLDRVFRTPRIAWGWTAGPVVVEALTNYLRSDPMFVGPAEGYDPGYSAHSERMRLPDATAYRADAFARSSTEAAYGHPQRRNVPTMNDEHVLLRTALHRHAGALYLFVSNAYDARITTQLQFEGGLTDGLTLHEGRFDLDTEGAFVWSTSPDRLRMARLSGAHVLDLKLEPYEVRLFQLAP